MKRSQSKTLGQLKEKPAASMKEFSKRVNSILWREDKKAYERFGKMSKEFEANGMNRSQAIVQAAKDYPCLKQLFRTYSRCIRPHDPHPDSHPGIYTGQLGKIQCEQRELSHRENLAWAIEAAGKEARTGDEPESCPNDAAYYLYRQACDEPGKFLDKFTQMAAHKDDESDKQRRAKRGGERSIEEINFMLKTLIPGNEKSKEVIEY